jgi:hypothetical protein
MTERKPPEISFTTWIDQQINEAAERGAFDNLPGAGRPLPNRGEADDGQAWLREYLRREGVSPQVMLPAPLKLRKESELLAQMVHVLPSEEEVRAAVAELNARIMDWRRIPLGPPVFVALVDTKAMVSRWRDAQPASPPAAPSAGGHPAPGKGPARPPWWRRLRRRPG